ncbi:MAG: type IV secretory system conjugative DNA transfer family protein [Patescibacteria group bacterium]
MAQASPQQDGVLLLIKVAHDNTRNAAVFEQFLDNLHGVLGGRRFALEVVSLHQHIYLFVWCRKNQVELLQGQIYAEYPDCEIEFVKDYSAIGSQNDGLHFAGAELALQKTDLYPIKTYSEIEGVSTAAILTMFSKAKENEQVWMQIVLEPGAGEGKMGFKRILRLKFRNILARFNLMKFFRTKKRSDILKKEIDSASKKADKDNFLVTIRLAFFCPDPSLAKQKLQGLINAFSIYEEQDLNGFKSSKITQHPGFITKYQKRDFGAHKYTFNIEELSTIYHLPKGAKSEIPNLVCTISKKAEPPMDLPKEGTSLMKDISFFAVTNFHNQYIKFGMKRSDRRRHLYVVGKSGTGKSKLLELLIIEDILAGEGVGVLDPHGDLVENVMKHVPEERMNDVVYFNPADLEHPIGFNPIECTAPEYRQHVAMGFIEIFKKMFGSNWSSRLEHVLQYTVLALFEYPNSTIFGILKMLTDKNYRQKVVAKVQDPVVKNFWVNEFAAWSEKFDNEAIVPVLNKVGQFVSTSLVRNIVGQPKNRMDMDDIMNNQKILLMNVSKGNLTEEISALIGSMVITSLYQSAMKRAALPEEQRKDFYFYVDEFQNFATRTFGEILSEARKYRLNLTVSHQHLGQLSDYIKSMVFGNVGSMVAFRVGAADAYNIEQEFTPIFKANDIINLGVREFYVKMSVNGALRDPFSGYTLTVPEVKKDLSQEIMRLSRERYGTPRKEAERMIEVLDKGGEEYMDEITPMPGEEDFTAPLV